MIPLLDLKAQFAQYRTEAMAAIERVIESQHFIMGPEVTAFEQALGAYAGVRPAVSMSSGTDALLAALMALNVGPGDEVITTPFTFFATAGTIARLGATPVFVDIDPGTFNLTEAGVRAAITAKTKAIIPVHLFGQVCDLGSLYEDPTAPPIIEDAAQALGAKLRGKPTGQFGICSCVSFFPAKNLGCFGDGGGVLTQDADFEEKLRILRLHGSKPKYFHHVVGGNFRLDALQAAVLSVKLPLLDGWGAGRRANAARYVALLTEAGLVERGLITLPTVLPEAEHVYNQFVIRAEDRDGLQAHLNAAGIGSAIYYPGPLHLQPCFADLGHVPGDFPEAERACDEVLALPIFPELGEARLAAVVASIKAFYA